MTTAPNNADPGRTDSADRSPSKSAWALKAVVVALSLVAYIAAGYGLSRYTHHQINPDGINYIRIAQYYAGGHFDLAVNPYWGPLLSWLTVPGIWLGIDPALFIKYLGIAFGLCMTLAGVGLMRTVNRGRGGFAIFPAGLLLALTMIPHPVTPDLLLAFLITSYIAVTAHYLVEGGPARLFLAGLVGGFAYLAKAYALPFVLIHGALTIVLRAVLARRRGEKTRFFSAALAGLIGVAVTAGPWMFVLSLNGGEFASGSSAGRMVRSLHPMPEDEDIPLAHIVLQKPREGRVCAWENPTEIRAPWRGWSPFDSKEALKHQIKLAAKLTVKLGYYVSQADAFSMIFTGLLVSTLLLLFSLFKTLRLETPTLRLWMAFTILLFLSGYAILYAEPRYVWPILTPALVLTLQLFEFMRADSEAGGVGEGERHRLYPFLTICLIFSLCVANALSVQALHDPEGRNAYHHWLYDQAKEVKFDHPLVANDWSEGLYLAYWNGNTYYGAYESEEADELAEELRPFAPVDVVVFRNAGLADQLSRDERFQEIFAARRRLKETRIKDLPRQYFSIYRFDGE